MLFMLRGEFSVNTSRCPRLREVPNVRVTDCLGLFVSINSLNSFRRARSLISVCGG